MIEQRKNRKLDIANATVNVTQLVVIVGAVWTAAMCYRDLTERIAQAEARQIQLQSQIGELNARLAGIHQ